MCWTEVLVTTSCSRTDLICSPVTEPAHCNGHLSLRGWPFSFRGWLRPAAASRRTSVGVVGRQNRCGRDLAQVRQEIYLALFQRTNEQRRSGRASTSVALIFTDPMLSPEDLIPVNLSRTRHQAGLRAR